MVIHVSLIYFLAYFVACFLLDIESKFFICVLFVCEGVRP